MANRIMSPQCPSFALCERQHLLGVGREDSEWGRRTTEGVLPEAIEVGVSLQPVLECLRHLLAQRSRRVGCRIQ